MNRGLEQVPEPVLETAAADAAGIAVTLQRFGSMIDAHAWLTESHVANGIGRAAADPAAAPHNGLADVWGRPADLV
jgi:hypothetical protein